jgi:peptidoglycan-associated lipoprotein
VNSRTSTFLVISTLAVLTLTGCPPKKKMPIEERPKEEVSTDTQPTDANATAPGDIQISQDWVEIPDLALVNFDYDSATLSDSARATLKTNVAILKKLPSSVTFRVEGHCDDRGTVEYNIALGQRRATAVASFYGTAGLGKSRIKTISYGEERPLCSDANDACWAKNRRSVTTVRNETPVTIKGDSLK